MGDMNDLKEWARAICYGIQDYMDNMNDLKEWARAICYGIQDYMENMSEEEIQQHMDDKREFLAMFGIDAEKIKAGFEEWMGMSFEDVKQRIEDAQVDHDGLHDDQKDDKN